MVYRMMDGVMHRMMMYRMMNGMMHRMMVYRTVRLSHREAGHGYKYYGRKQKFLHGVVFFVIKDRL
jgi:hypothetical protein